MNEIAVTALLCNLLSGGATEVRHEFPNLGGTRIVRVDCETPTHVIEVGLDGSASGRDSVHQAVFAAHLTGKIPMVVLIDRDGREGRYEYEMRQVTSALGIDYATCQKSFVERWAATALFRGLPIDKDFNDVPVDATARRHCDLGSAFSIPALD